MNNPNHAANKMIVPNPKIINSTQGTSTKNLLTKSKQPIFALFVNNTLKILLKSNGLRIALYTGKTNLP